MFHLGIWDFTALCESTAYTGLKPSGTVAKLFQITLTIIISGDFYRVHSSQSTIIRTEPVLGQTEFTTCNVCLPGSPTIFNMVYSLFKSACDCNTGETMTLILKTFHAECQHKDIRSNRSCLRSTNLPWAYYSSHECVGYIFGTRINGAINISQMGVGMDRYEKK